MVVLKEIIEYMYYLGGAAIAIIGFLGLKQLKIGLEQIKLSKMDIEIRSKREAALIAINQTEIYCNEIIPAHDDLFLTWDKYGIPIYSTDKATFDPDDNSYIGFIKQLRKARSSLGEELVVEILKSELYLCNKLEAIATYFVTGIADEEIAFISIGRTYCKHVEEFSFTISKLSSESGYYKNVRRLYEIWHTRLNQQKLEEESKRISEELKAIKPEYIKPIGNNVSS
jgi:hypothetical protein